MISPYDLHYFHEVARVRNLGRAAQALGISQPALTHALHRLEAQLGQPLCERGRRGVVLTEAGRRLLARGQGLLQEWQGLAKILAKGSKGHSGRVRLGCHPSVAQYSLPVFLRHVLRENPELDLELVHGLSREMTRAVVGGEIDLAIVINPHPHADLVMRRIGEDEVRLWHREREFDRETIIYDPALAQAQWILKKMARKNPFKRKIESGNLDVISRLVQSGCGVGILPGRVLAGSNTRPLPNSPTFRDEIFLIYRRASAAIIELARQVEAKLKSEF